MIAPAEVTGFWFGGVSEDAAGLETAFRRWFQGGDALDAEIRERFGDAVELALDGGFAEWEGEARTRLALILLLDQFPRNIFRHTAKAFAGDARALRLSRETVSRGEDRELAPLERFFLLMPCQHAEDRGVQENGVRLFAALVEDAGQGPAMKILQSGLDYARKHRDIIERFGRFPYRNDVLGRTTTAEEARWLDESPERFGQ